MVNKIYTRWSKDGIYCEETNAHCQNCDVYKATGMHKNGKLFRHCHMPNSIKALKKLGIEKSIAFFNTK